MKPIRCYTCGKILGNKWITIERLHKDGKSLKEIYQIIGITRYCCKRIILSSVDVFDIESQHYDELSNIKIHSENPNKNFLKVV